MSHPTEIGGACWAARAMRGVLLGQRKSKSVSLSAPVRAALTEAASGVRAATTLGSALVRYRREARCLSPLAAGSALAPGVAIAHVRRVGSVREGQMRSSGVLTCARGARDARWRTIASRAMTIVLRSAWGTRSEERRVGRGGRAG